jgi:hypothetical protein
LALNWIDGFVSIFGEPNLITGSVEVELKIATQLPMSRGNVDLFELRMFIFMRAQKTYAAGMSGVGASRALGPQLHS